MHTKCLPFPYELIRKIEDYIFEKLSSGTPAVSSYGPFSDFKDQLVAAGIPNEIALYSCLRISADPRISCPQQPYVLLSGNEKEFVSVSVYLEEFVRDYGTAVPPDVIRRFAFDDLNLKEFQLHNFMSQNPAIYGSIAAGYIHESNLNIDLTLISPLLTYTRRLLEKFDGVSLKKVFDEQAVICRLSGINNPSILGYVIEKLSNSDLEVHRNHHIIKSNLGVKNNIYNIILNYIIEKDSPCSYKELYDHFIESRGYGQASLNMVFYGNDVFRYISGCVIHPRTIGVDTKMFEDVEIILDKVYRKRILSGDIHASVADVIEEEDLPSLTKGFYWSETLLSDFVKKSSKIRSFGYNQIPYVSVESSINSLDELIANILERKFGGSENFNKFTKYLSNMRIIDKSIPESMLKESDFLVVTNGEIFVRNLHAN